MANTNRITTGLPGLDEILQGGLIPRQAYLVLGGPGSGKSTLASHFISEASQKGQNTLYITMSESADRLQRNANKLGIDMSQVHFLDFSPGDDITGNTRTYNVFSTAEVEQGPILDELIETIGTEQPSRVVLDSITMLRLMNENAFHDRKMMLSLINFICRQGATLLIISEYEKEENRHDPAFWVDGIIEMNNQSEWRKITVTKFRGSEYLSGNHAFKITEKGITIFPQLRPSQYSRTFQNETLSTGIAELDSLLHGGIENGTTNLLIGATGVGKTNLGLQVIKEAAARNERSAIYTFEESKELIIRRSEMIGVPIKTMIEKGNLKIVPIEPLSYSPDEFAKMVRRDVEEENTRIVMIDSIGGYNLSVREENILERLHALTVYLQNMGVTTLLLKESQNITGSFKSTNMNASYLADNILFLRYLEINGELRKAIGVLKKRLSNFENTIREFEITSEGIKIGKPLQNMRGILSGLPEVVN